MIDPSYTTRAVTREAVINANNEHSDIRTKSLAWNSTGMNWLDRMPMLIGRHCTTAISDIMKELE